MSRTGILTFERDGEKHRQVVEHTYSDRWRATLDGVLRDGDVLASAEVVLSSVRTPVPSPALRFAGGPCEVRYWIPHVDGVSVVVGFDPPLERA